MIFFNRKFSSATPGLPGTAFKDLFLSFKTFVPAGKQAIGNIIVSQYITDAFLASLNQHIKLFLTTKFSSLRHLNIE